MGPQVVPVTSAQGPRAAEVLARAFMDNQVIRALCPDDRRRLRMLGAVHRWDMAYGLLDGRVVETTPSLTAVSMWTAPGHRSSAWAVVRALPLLLKTGRAMTREQAHWWIGYSRRYDQRRHQLLPEPHWDLDWLGVLPEKQRLGLGAVLVRHGLQRAQADHAPVYIETDTQANYEFYAKCGLDLVEYVHDYPPLNVPTWRMVYRPG